MLLYYITDGAQLPGREALLQRIAAAARAGVDYIQLRERDLTAGELQRLARDAMEALRGAPTRLLVNSRSDVALAVAAHGVHLRSDDVSPADVRALFRQAGAAPPVIAVSCHTAEEVARAEARGADFAVFGPVFEKPEGTPQGLAALAAACRGRRIPVLALGGVTVQNAAACLAAGAAGLAGIRLFQEGDIAATVRALRSLAPR